MVKANRNKTHKFIHIWRNKRFSEAAFRTKETIDVDGDPHKIHNIHDRIIFADTARHDPIKQSLILFMIIWK